MGNFNGIDNLFQTVIPGPAPGIHLDFELQLSININFKMDYRVKPGNDDRVSMDYRVIQHSIGNRQWKLCNFSATPRLSAGRQRHSVFDYHSGPRAGIQFQSPSFRPTSRNPEVFILSLWLMGDSKTKKVKTTGYRIKSGMTVGVDFVCHSGLRAGIQYQSPSFRPPSRNPGVLGLKRLNINVLGARL